MYRCVPVDYYFIIEFVELRWEGSGGGGIKKKNSSLTTDWVLQSCPAIVRSNRNWSLLSTSMLHVSDRPSAYILPLNGLFVRTCTAIFVSLQWTDTGNQTSENRSIENAVVYAYKLFHCDNYT